jgi:hypothetical protein
MHDDDNGPPWKGQGQHFDDACTAAWNNAKGKTQARTFKVESIEIECENPIRTYIVTINPTGG